MALGKSISFIKTFMHDKEFRHECNKIQKEELLIKYDFTEGEFEDAITMQLFKCQTYEDADLVQQVKFWFTLL
jgi:hypothetical protein